jgi:hypothetical protein
LLTKSLISLADFAKKIGLRSEFRNEKNAGSADLIMSREGRIHLQMQVVIIGNQISFLLI